MAEETDPPTNCVILHHPDAVDTSRPKLMGRHAAGEGFLKGFVRHSGVDGFHAQCFTRDHFEDFKKRVGALDPRRRPCHLVMPGRMGTEASTPRTLVLPGPDISPFAWRRRRQEGGDYSIVGLTHTTASETAMTSICDLSIAPTRPWDALVCTSAAVRGMVVKLIEGWHAYLGERLGTAPGMALELPVIPLGVDCDAFAAGPNGDATRRRLRRRLGIGDDDVVVLFMGRLSFHAKAHPLPMYVGLEAAASRTGKKIHLIQAGWFANAAIERQFRDAASQLCPSVNAIFLDGREPEVRAGVWFAADAFTSLSDNVQETFGLTPIEAMAAGLPSVITDWNGYRDTVRHGTDGFSVATWMPAAGFGSDIALPPEIGVGGPDNSYDHYCGNVSQSTAVDVAAAATAYAALVANPDLRRSMGQAARRRALDTFDWRVVVAAYQDLWRHLAEVRSAAAGDAGIRVATARPPVAAPLVPLYDDPFRLFEGYPTARIRRETEVRPAPGADGKRLATLRQSTMNNFAAQHLLGEADTAAILKHLADRGPTSAGDLADWITPDRPEPTIRTIAWMAKMGLVTLFNPTPSAIPEPAADDAEEEEPEPAPAFEADPAPAPEPEPPPEPEEEASEPAPEPYVSSPDASAAPPPPMDFEGLKEAGLAAREKGDVGAALGFLQKALALQPDDVDLNITVGEMLAASQSIDAAIDCFRLAIAAAPDRALAHVNLGKALMLKGRSDEAIAAFRKAVELAPEDADTAYILGVALRRAGALFEAVQALRGCVEKRADRPDFLYQLGLALKAQGRRAEAMDCYRKGIHIAPTHVYLKAAEASLVVDNRRPSRAGRGKRGGRIALFMGQPFHHVLLRPAFDALAESRWPLLTGDVKEAIEFDADVVVTCDTPPPALRHQAPQAQFVYVQPGFTGGKRMVGPAIAADYAAVVTAADRERLIAAGLPTEKIWPIGALQMDRLFRCDPGPPPLPPVEGKKTVLFAPTADPRLSAAPMLTDYVADRIRGTRTDVRVVVKPHPLTCDHQPKWMAWWRGLAAADADVHLVEDAAADAQPWLGIADVLVTDASSVAFQYLALDRPIVLVTNPARGRPGIDYDPDAVEWRWRTIGEEVTSADALAAAVGRALADPGGYRAQRAECRRELFDGLDDGQATDRLVARLKALGG